ncbi:hypothetical protein [Haladaptatus halobius]|uniref:hypothetical protein n=1 Tax=Haladaptatus halobius TaxID=2884875 RepID=UPI001D09BAA1|nr:hypothetical protein [Haladaptatus halobius]
MTENGSLVESPLDRSLRKSEKEALESHARLQSIMLQNPMSDSEHGEIIETAMFIGYD